MTSRSPVEVRETISPELVLVAPPDVARAARERLPEQSFPAPRRFRAAPAFAVAGGAFALPMPAARARRRRWAWWLLAVAMLAVAAVAVGLLLKPLDILRGGSIEWRSLSGSANNSAHPTWGEGDRPYLRLAPFAYADGIAEMETGPSPRYISNRVFNDVGQNLFSENGVSQWGWVWGQFLDHSFGLRNETPGEKAPIPFSAKDPLERFTNDLGAIDFARTPAAPGTGRTTPREQINTVPSYIDAYAVYGDTNSRLEWLREGPVNGDLSDQSAMLVLPGGYLPRATARGKAPAPQMDLMGPLQGHAEKAAVAGDVRANENIALTATHTLFAREHNRLVGLLPTSLSEEERFEIARRVVGAEQQYITYHEFLPALGIFLPRYTGYDPDVDPTLSNEFATAGYRVHSMIHGEFEPRVPEGTYTEEELDTFQKSGIGVERDEGDVELVIPLGLAFGNPDLLQTVGLGPLLKGLGAERQYRNDEQIDESLRSILFQIPKPGSRDPGACATPTVQPGCFSVVQDLGAIDIQRGRDHGIPHYNQLRTAYGLAPKSSYTAITGESTERFPRDSRIDRRDPIDDPSILDFTKLADKDGEPIEPTSEEAGENVVTGIRRTTLAARLRGVYGDGNIDQVDAFVGMLSEPHVRGTEFGELQLAIWTRQFAALRDGDRFFYLNDPELDTIREKYGIDYRQTLADVIEMNSGESVAPNVFKVAGG
jgi:hypothetical protein